MANLILRNKIFFNQLRQLHRSTVVYDKPSFASAKENSEFKGVFNQVLNSLITSPKISKVPEVSKYVQQIFDYTATGGKHSRGLCVPMAYQLMENPNNITEENVHSARVLGWCAEMLHGWFYAADDVLDGSTTRRGKTCWYKLPDVRSYPIVDSLLMGQCIIQTLEVNFGNKPYCHDAIRHFNEAILYTSMGEYLDCSATYSKEKDTLNLFNMERYCTAAKYKGAYYSFRLPICLSLLLMKNNKNISKEWSDLCLDIGLFHQIKNDYTDVYGDNAVTGKIGSDIREGKLTWLSVTALELCNDTQRSTFKKYYGSKDPEHTEHIMKLYDDLQLPSVFKNHEKERHSGLLKRINDLPTEGERKCFNKILDASTNDLY